MTVRSGCREMKSRSRPSSNDRSWASVTGASPAAAPGALHRAPGARRMLAGVRFRLSFSNNEDIVSRRSAIHAPLVRKSVFAPIQSAIIT